MTYPPQQPGPYGQDPYGQQNPYGQQHPYGQQDPYGRQTPYPQQDPYGQQSGQFGQQPYAGGGYPGGGQPGGEPPKSRTGLIVAVVVIALVVLGGGGTGIYFLTKGDDTSNAGSANTSTSTKAKAPDPGPGDPSEEPDESPSPRPTAGGGGGGGGGGDDEALIIEVAEKYADAVASRDESAAKELNCTKDSAGILFDTATAPNTKIEVDGKPDMVGADRASVTLNVVIGSSEPIPFPLLMSNEGGWCVTT